MGRRRRPGNSTPQKTNNSIDDLVGNEENVYQMNNDNYYHELSDIHKKSL
jgi:hypothetical protein